MGCFINRTGVTLAFLHSQVCPSSIAKDTEPTRKGPARVFKFHSRSLLDHDGVCRKGATSMADANRESERKGVSRPQDLYPGCRRTETTARRQAGQDGPTQTCLMDVCGRRRNREVQITQPHGWHGRWDRNHSESGNKVLSGRGPQFAGCRGATNLHDLCWTTVLLSAIRGLVLHLHLPTINAPESL